MLLVASNTYTTLKIIAFAVSFIKAGSQLS